MGVLADGESFPDDARRRLSLLIAGNTGTGADAGLLAIMICDSGALLSADDFLWLLQRADTANPVEQAAIHRLLPRLVDPTRIDHATAVLSLDQDSPLRPALATWLGVCDLADPKVAEIRAHWQRQRERRARRDNPQDDINDLIVTRLDSFESGDPDGYWIAARLVCVRPGTDRLDDEHEPDLTAHPRWDRLPASVRDRLIVLAPRYLTEGRCVPERWLGKSLDFHPAEAAYQALLLLLRHDPAPLDALPAAVWQEWAPIIVAWPTTINGAHDRDKKRLLQHALPHALPHAREQLRAALIAVSTKRSANAPATHAGPAPQQTFSGTTGCRRS